MINILREKKNSNAKKHLALISCVNITHLEHINGTKLYITLQNVCWVTATEFHSVTPVVLSECLCGPAGESDALRVRQTTHRNS